jgi:hypothetical protein
LPKTDEATNSESHKTLSARHSAFKKGTTPKTPPLAGPTKRT